MHLVTRWFHRFQEGLSQREVVSRSLLPAVIHDVVINVFDAICRSTKFENITHTNT